MRLLFLLAIVATIGCDQVTKRVATAELADTPGRSYLGGSVRLEYAENTGGFLGLGADLPPEVRAGIFTTATGLLLLAVAGVAIHQRWRGLPLVGMTLFVTGGASNWVDRFIRGSVVDFMVVRLGPIRTGIFNVADVAIMVGLGFFVWSELNRLLRPSSSTDARRIWRRFG
jgi:signal peptidase II